MTFENLNNNNNFQLDSNAKTIDIIDINEIKLLINIYYYNNNNNNISSENENDMKPVTDINKECFRNEIPLHKACRADMNKKNVNGEIPLHRVYEGRNENVFIYFVEHGADINKEDNIGEMPLHKDCKGGNENIVKYLIEHVVDVNEEDNHNEIPLHIAGRKRNKNIVRYLVEHSLPQPKSYFEKFKMLSIKDIYSNIFQRMRTIPGLSDKILHCKFDTDQTKIYFDRYSRFMEKYSELVHSIYVSFRGQREVQVRK
ncbi:ankyrin repeat-containing domain protein [Neocallimastix lanati (nom. inval.)]|nr:ankyrin repeat-containing domain protein [Neocallimastix sp. JGI-2020a]